MKHDVVKKYNLPKIVKFCKKCVISNQRPRITFNEYGICSACEFSEYKKSKIDWNIREKELVELCNKHRKNNGEYDILVPCSGGKDGSFVAHQLKYKYGMNPLTVTWSPLIKTAIGIRNLTNFVKSGFDNILGTPNGDVTRKMTNLCAIHMGDPFQPFIYGQYNFPLRIAVQNKISIIMYGENGEVEYGGDMKTAHTPTRELIDQSKTYFSGMGPDFWLAHGITDKDLHYFKAPSFDDITSNNTELHFMGYYKFWDPQENFYYCQKNTGFEINDMRSEGTYSKYASLDDELDGFHYYLMYLKFGIGRATSDAAHEIRDGKITREEGQALVRRYDGEFPNKYYKTFLEYCGMKPEEFQAMCDSWRSDHLWSKSVNGDWKLKHTVFED